MIKFNNVSYTNEESSKKLILDNVSFLIEKNKYNIILGQNGSGKTTIIKLILGLLKVNSGDIYIEEEKLEYNQQKLYEIRKKIGVVFQNMEEQFIGEKVFDNLIFQMENNRLSDTKMKENLKKYINLFQIEDLLNKKISSLSSGEKQKVAIATAMMIEPEILILDEALEMLDDESKLIINDFLRKYIENGKTIISISHNEDEICKGNNFLLLENKNVINITKNYNKNLKKINKEKINIFSKFKNKSKIDNNINNKIEIENLSFYYENSKKIFENLSFNIMENEITAIIGKSGSGKTTLLEIICGLIEQKKNILGNIKINFNNKNDKNKYFLNNQTNEKELLNIRKKVKMVFQNIDRQFFESSVKKELEYNILKNNDFEKELYKIKNKKEKDKQINLIINNQINKIIKKIGLDENILEKSPFKLSNGEKKLVGLAMAICTNPEILLLDEPTNSVDTNGIIKIMEILKNLKKNITIIIVTHDMKIIENYVDNVIEI